MLDMDMVDRAIKMGNFKYKLFCYFAALLGYSNHDIHVLEVRNKVLKIFEKKYGNLINVDNYRPIEKNIENKTVWVCWLQGYDSAPDIVKTCIGSMRKWLPDYEIIFIDEKNLNDYTDLPKHVIDKWKKGIISNTLLSDFIRLSILSQFGGIWTDSTVLFTGPLPEYVNRSSFFMYRCSNYDVAKFGESWFIKSYPHNFVIEETLKLMCKYWEKENKARDYFQMFIFMRMVVNKKPDCVKEMIRIPYDIPIMMQKYINNAFDKEIFDDICAITSIHKLTYKGIEANKHTTFADYIIRGDELL